jgi:asparagine synthase (glutamine-hydrolysing)
MTRPTTAGQSLKSRYLAGWLDQNPVEWDAETALAKMRKSSHSSLRSDMVCTPQASCLTTDHIYNKQKSFTAAITGTPRWKSNTLNQLAFEKGHAYTLLSAYKQQGTDFISDLSGAFSFVIINHDTLELLAGTDRMGQYPLYYSSNNSGVIFGSSVSIVLAHPSVEREIQPQGIYDYVYFHMVPSPHSIFTGVNKLPAGHLINYKNGSATVANYWQPRFSETTNVKFPEMAEQLKSELKDSVRRSLSPDISVGAFLSGGLDSSSVTGMLAEASEQKAQAFSIGFSAKGYDEMAYARITAEHFGVKLHEYYVTPEDVVDALPMVAASYDEPFGNSSALPAYFCAKLAAENGIGRLLAGDGGDEIFAGNERYLKQRVFEAYRKLPGALRRGVIEPITRNLPRSVPFASKANSYLDQANTPLPDRLQSYNFLHRHQPNEIFNDDFVRQVNVSTPIELQREIYHRPENAETLNRMLYLDWQYTLADNDLRKVSHMCALAGVDVAYPMLDDDLIEFSCQIPSNWKIKGKDLRHFYKQSLTNWLPNETINKEKQGFGLPFGVWMKTHKPLQEMAYDNMLALKQRGFFRPEFIDHAIDLHRNQHAAYYGELVWILTVLELWMSNHL